MFRRENSPMWVLVLLYGMLVLSQLFWGLPNQQRLYVYHMDEWHQMQSVRNVFRYGTPNVAGSANGTMGHFLISGVLSAPLLMLVKLVNGDIEVLSSAWEWQRLLFIYLRLQTLIFGIGTMVVFMRLMQKHFSKYKFWGMYFFVFSGAWLSYSSYFKYDIALMFWMVLGLLKILDYGKSGLRRDYWWAGLFVGMATATKVSTPPLILLYVGSFWLYTPKASKKIWMFGLVVMSVVILLLGVPDLILGTGNYSEYLLSNLVWNPKAAANWDYAWWQKTLMAVINIEAVVGGGVMLLAIVGLMRVKWSKLLADKDKILIMGWVILFGMSLMVLGWYAFGNRMLVLIPGLAIMASWGVVWMRQRKLSWVAMVLVVFQAVSAVSWVGIKWQLDPREKSFPVLESVLEREEPLGYYGNAIYVMWPDKMFMRWVEEQRLGIKTMRLVDMGRMTLSPEYVVITDSLPGRVLKGTEKYQVLRWIDDQEYELVEQERATLPPWYWWIHKRTRVIPPKLVPQPLDISVLQLKS